MLKFESYQFKRLSDNELIAVSGELRVNQSLQISGPSGVGKTTFLESLILSPSFNDQVIFETKKINNAKNLKWLYQPAQNAFFDEWTAQENLYYVLKNTTYLTKVEKRDLITGLKDIFVKFKLKDIIQSKVAELSQGEKQRLGLLRSMLLKPALYLLDEPFSHLDDENVKFWSECFMGKLKENSSLAIIVSHQNQLICDKQASLESNCLKF